MPIIPDFLCPTSANCPSPESNHFSDIFRYKLVLLVFSMHINEIV